jgi:hypothetical protein
MSHIDEVLQSEIAAVETQLGRTDGKTGILLGLSSAGATAGPLLIVGGDLSIPAAVPAWIAVGLFVVAAAFLSVAIRPRIAPNEKLDHGFLRYANVPADQIVQMAAQPRTPLLATRLCDLASLTLAKYRHGQTRRAARYLRERDVHQLMAVFGQLSARFDDWSQARNRDGR